MTLLKNVKKGRDFSSSEEEALVSLERRKKATETIYRETENESNEDNSSMYTCFVLTADFVKSIVIQ